MGFFGSAMTRGMFAGGMAGAGIGYIAGDRGDKFSSMMIGAGIGTGGAYGMGRYLRSFGQEVMKSNRPVRGLLPAHRGPKLKSNRPVNWRKYQGHPTTEFARKRPALPSSIASSQGPIALLPEHASPNFGPARNDISAAAQRIWGVGVGR